MSASENLLPSASGNPNKLELALADYHLLEQEVESLKDQVKTYSELSIKLQAENDAQRNQIKEQADFYGKQIATITTHRDRLERLLKGLLTRFKVIKECFAQAEAEAHLEAMKVPSSAASAAQRSPTVVVEGQRTTALPTNDLG